MSTTPPVAEASEDPRLEAAVRGVLRSPAWERPPRSPHETRGRISRRIVRLQILDPGGCTYGVVREALRDIAVAAVLEFLRNPPAPGELAIPESEERATDRRRILFDQALGDPEHWPGFAPASIDEVLGQIARDMPGLGYCDRSAQVAAAADIAIASVLALARIPGMAGVEGDPLGAAPMPSRALGKL